MTTTFPGLTEGADLMNQRVDWFRVITASLAAPG